MNKAYYVNHIQEKQANACFRLSVVDGKTRVGLFAKRAIEQGEELLAYSGSECKNLFNARTQDSQTSQAVQTPEREMIDAGPEVAGVIQPAKYSTRSYIPPSASHRRPKESMSLKSRKGRSSTDPHCSAAGEYGIQGKSTVPQMNSTSFRVTPKAKHPYYSIRPVKKWETSQYCEMFYGEHRASIKAYCS